MNPIKSRFFCSSSDSESDSDTDADALTATAQTAQKVNHLEMFPKYIKDPSRFESILTRHKRGDNPTTRYLTYLKSNADPYEPFSPTGLTQEYIKGMDTEDDDLFSVNKTVVTEYVGRVKKAPDSPTRKLMGTRINQGLDLLSGALSSAPRNTAAYHREAASNPSLACILGAIQELRNVDCVHFPPTPSSYVPIINLVHITEGERGVDITRGYHFNVQHAMNVRIKARNPHNQVTCGVFRLQDSHREKFSTFFPASVNSEDALVRVIQHAEKIAQKENRLLYRSIDLPIYIEKLFQDKGCIVQSAYPLFFYEEFQANQTYQVTENAVISSSEILSRLSDPLVVHERTQYDLGDNIILDIAPLFIDKTNGVEFGIDFRFPKNLLLPAIT